jgi:hypothetical protein
VKNLHKKSTLEGERKPTPSGKPVKPKKPLPTVEESAKVSVPCAVLTETRVREIVRKEIRIETARKNKEFYSNPFNSPLRKYRETAPTQEA